jgi:Protein of unknown function (DUF1176)
MRVLLALLPSFLVPLAANAQKVPTAGELKVYRDWIVGCDNITSCHATSLDPEAPGAEPSSDAWGGALISVKRDPAERSAVNVAISLISGLDEGSDVTVAQLMVDDRKWDISFRYEKGVINLAPRSDGSVVRELLAGKTLYLLDQKGEVVASASLIGLREALRHIDTVQKRAGTPAAIIEKGHKAFTGPAALPPYPTIQVPDPTAKPPTRLNPAADEQARAFHKCRAPEDVMRRLEIKYARLDRSSTLAIIPALCGTGAYNSTVRIAIVDNNGGIVTPRFDMRKAGGKPDQFINGWWDASSGLLSSYAKSRGLGDCGLFERYAWDGERFRLAEREEMTECRGSIDYITTWRANVVRKRAAR